MKKIKSFNSYINEAVISSKKEGEITYEVEGDKEAYEKAREMVGDGKEPAKFFITYTNEYMYKTEEGIDYYTSVSENAPIKVSKVVTTYLPIEDDWETAKQKADEIELDFSDKNLQGAGRVSIEDRWGGTIYERCIIVSSKFEFDEDVIDNGKTADKHYSK